ncbi:hypothetical protein PR003_g16216 [Phytophthora rubi]|uniref:Uncharacterized protein n=1 Tax=Phytophthora rubi TaxID=129364 RepID=A0A6A4EI68_9STRA|nr:hypothetical protein PR001_g16822 [Phytophthora rubi]KAE9008083.1 hypothetical protein PR002_g16006 [Phytophthora rubi]KAE9326538.1 hypothetical protein PR003_g16216 [Phytophthora rubi]
MLVPVASCLLLIALLALEMSLGIIKEAGSVKIIVAITFCVEIPAAVCTSIRSTADICAALES